MRQHGGLGLNDRNTTVSDDHMIEVERLPAAGGRDIVEDQPARCPHGFEVFSDVALAVSKPFSFDALIAAIRELLPDDGVGSQTTA